MRDFHAPGEASSHPENIQLIKTLTISSFVLLLEAILVFLHPDHKPE
jgi:hypothetical protein